MTGLFFHSQHILAPSLGCHFDEIQFFNTIFKNTITSYSPNRRGISSGKTGSDIERILAFNYINKKDPIQYQKPWKDIVKHALKVEKEFVK